MTAKKIKARAIRRAGEILATFQADQAEVMRRAVSGGGDTNEELPSQGKSARKAGFSKRQEVQASRVAKIPEEEFEREIEKPSGPPTVTKLADMGNRAVTISHIPEETVEAEKPPTVVKLGEMEKNVRSLKLLVHLTLPLRCCMISAAATECHQRGSQSPYACEGMGIITLL